MVETYTNKAVAALARRMETCSALWVMGGSTALGLRGAALASSPRDIDIYADEADARTIHEHLRDWATDTQQTSVTERYRSILSHYAVSGAAVELVGEFRIETAGSQYLTEVSRMLYPAGDLYRTAEGFIRLVPLGHELIFNVLRERADRCELVGGLIRQQSDLHLPVLRSLLERNELSVEARRQIRQYAGMADDE